MDPSRGGDSRYNLNYGMGGIGLSLADQADLYGNPTGGLGTGGRPPSGGLIQSMGRSSGLMSHTGGNGGGGGGGGGPNAGGGSVVSGGGAGQCQSMGGQSRGIKRTSSDCYDDHHRGSGGSMTSQTLQGLESCGAGNGSGGGGQQPSGNVPDVVDDSYTSLQNKKSPPANGKKTKGRVKIKMEYIDNKLRRYTTFSKRKTGIMKKAYELSTLTGTQVMLLVASETGHVYTFATRKLQPMITSEAGKQLIQTCLNSPDPPTGGSGGGDQRMSATGFEETELSYNIADEDSKDDRSPISSGNESDDSSDMDSPRPSSIPNSSHNVLPIAAGAAASSSSGSPPLLVDAHNQKQNLIHHHGASQSTSSAAAVHYDVMKLSPLTQLSGASNVVYPASALGGLPQEVLLGLVQSGHLQLHSEEDSGGSSGGGHQFITIPISMAATAANSSTSSVVTATSSGSGGGDDIDLSSTGNGCKIRVRDLSKNRQLLSSSSAVTTSISKSINGEKDSPSSAHEDTIRIKTEVID